MKKFELKENTHIILKVDHLNELFDNKEHDLLFKSVNLLTERKKLNGYKESEYYICNKDEHYAQDVFDLIKRSIMIRDASENDMIALGEDGEWFAIEREVFDRLFKELDPMDPHIGFDEEELMKLLLIDWIAAIVGEIAIDVEVKEWYESIETKYAPYEDGEEYDTYPKDTKKEGKHYTFYVWYDCK